MLAAVAAAAPANAATVRWHKPARIDPRNGGISAVACPSSRLCVAVDQSGFALVTTNSGRSWRKPVRIDSGANAPLTGISCPTTKLCVAIDSSGNVITSRRPTGGSRAWSHPAHVDANTAPSGGSVGLSAISCPSVTLCVAVDGASPANVVTSTTPTRGASAWKLAAVGGVLTSVSCPTVTLCVAAGSQHYFSASPTAGASSWHATGSQTGGGTFSDITCTLATLCLASGYGNTSTGLVTSTASPTHPGASTWSTVGVEPSPPGYGTGLLDSIGCMAGSLCIATDSADNAFVSSTPASGTWTGPTQFARASSPTAAWSSIACAPALCVVVDSNGYAITATKH